MPANSGLLGQHVLVQAILTSNCSLTECTCLWSSSVTFNPKRLQCASRFNSHFPRNYTTMNSNCKNWIPRGWMPVAHCWGPGLSQPSWPHTPLQDATLGLPPLCSLMCYKLCPLQQWNHLSISCRASVITWTGGLWSGLLGGAYIHVVGELNCCKFASSNWCQTFSVWISHVANIFTHNIIVAKQNLPLFSLYFDRTSWCPHLNPMLLPEKPKCTSHARTPPTTMSGESQNKSKHLQLVHTAQFKSSIVTVNMYLTPTVLTVHTNDK